jgi:hypothetical protein
MNTPAWDRANFCFRSDHRDMADKSTWTEPTVQPNHKPATLSEGAIELLIEELEYIGDHDTAHRYITQLAILRAGQTTLSELE